MIGIQKTEQKLRTHARKVVTLSPPSSLQQIRKLGNTFVGEMKCRPYCSDILCFSFVENESTSGLTLTCASFLLFRSLVFNGQADLHIT